MSQTTQNQPQPATAALTFTTEQWCATLEKAVKELSDAEAEQKQLGFVPPHLIRAQLEGARTELGHLTQAQGVPPERLEKLREAIALLEKHHVVQTKIEDLGKRIKKLRVGAFHSIKQPDAANLTRAIGVMHAYPVFVTLGIGSVPALISCTRNQFALIARPASLGWGGAAVPERIDEDIVKQVETVLQSVGLRWRENNEKAKVRLPEAVLGHQFPPSDEPDPAKNPRKRRFSDQDFMGYGHPSVIAGISGRTPSLTKALSTIGLYCWDDLTYRTAAEMKGLLTEQQFSIVWWEMRRRGFLFQREEKPAVVFMDAIDADKINPDELKEEMVVSHEDRMRVRDKDGKLVGVIESKNQYTDRVGAEDDLQNEGGGEGPLGITENYEEREVEEEAVAPEPDEEPSQETQPAGLALQAQVLQAPAQAGIALQAQAQNNTTAAPAAATEATTVTGQDTTQDDETSEETKNA